MLKVNEIFFSIQGESSQMGWPCVFVRLAECDLRCTYCDTEYAFYEGEMLSLEHIIEKVSSYGCKLVEITGGEPLLQSEVYELMTRLCDLGFSVMLETGGHILVDKVDARVKKIIDMKTPSSGMLRKNDYRNLEIAAPTDEIKFVIGSRLDYDWAKQVIEQYRLTERLTVLMSVVFGELSPQTLAEWILADRLPVRFQLQMHKYIWSPETRGV
ncbi:MAG: radical SAM protein [Candidatus Thermochlorobacter aerophilum]|jgi:7-carboxy-7-deazaguanine synthase|uniref:7-carboxy-7-deazaguanine synthase n=1 Tax=Candidatus Thermochlorobacter aerophilus TaxID=1868324 RepID=A0A395M320_9BACT|nr:MAG: radical SAM protein [Candidatus Thermochlorobacter aerophilum]